MKNKKQRIVTIKVKEDGEHNWGVFWISDGGLETLWFNEFEAAFSQYVHLRKLKLRPSLNVKISSVKIGNKERCIL